MHECPDCGEQCECNGDLGGELHCEHVCVTDEEMEYQEDFDDGFFDDDIFYEE